MLFVLSGEGPSDVGNSKTGSPECSGGDFRVGPMTVVIDQVVEAKHGYSFLETDHYRFVHKSRLVEIAKAFKIPSNRTRLPGLKKRKETAYFYQNARALARYAKLKQDKLYDEVAAVLFRDSDGTASAGRGIWRDKLESMEDGFRDESFERGVPMVPKPKSEAWLICALKDKPYVGCDSLEERTGNDNSENSLKNELEKIVGHMPTPSELNQMVQNREINIDKIDMPSFNAFRDRLKKAIGLN